ncbi:MAG: DUF4386 family protein [Deltaproteobacteria bacterium]|nr:DUF4386 family protein [Deltaproteobacteria bacterium]
MENVILEKWTGVLAIVSSLMVTTCFILLAKTFGYPEIIRQSPEVILTRLYEQRHIVPYLYYVGVGLGGLCIFVTSILLRKILDPDGKAILPHLGQFCGVMSGFLLYVGIIRYVILFPFLAELRASGRYDTQTIDLVFSAFNTYVGVSVAEHVQFTFTSLMLIFFGIAVLKGKILGKWTGYFALLTAVVLLYGNLEPFGMPKSFFFNRLGSKLIAIWLLWVGVNLLLKNKGSLINRTFVELANPRVSSRPRA